MVLVVFSVVKSALNDGQGSSYSGARYGVMLLDLNERYVLIESSAAKM